MNTCKSLSGSLAEEHHGSSTNKHSLKIQAYSLGKVCSSRHYLGKAIFL